MPSRVTRRSSTMFPSLPLRPTRRVRLRVRAASPPSVSVISISLLRQYVDEVMGQWGLWRLRVSNVWGCPVRGWVARAGRRLAPARGLI
eukprot:2536602-Pyramimonas_sp.AAC.1